MIKYALEERVIKEGNPDCIHYYHFINRIGVCKKCKRKVEGAGFTELSEYVVRNRLYNPDLRSKYA